ncbi:MAG: cytochrome P450 [Candidatus Methylomirabilales bacterium]
MSSVLSPGVPALKAAPGPRGFPLLGVLPQAWKNPLEFFLGAARQYGDVVSLRLGFHRVYLLNHPDHVKYVLQDHYRNYRKPTRVEKVKVLFGEGVTVSEGDLWRRQRHLMEPAFSPQRIAALARVMTDATATMLERWRAVAARGEALDIAAEMMRLTQGIAVKTLFSTDVEGEVDAVRRALTIALEYVNDRAWAFCDLGEHMPTPRNRQFRHALRTLDRIAYRMIAARRKSAHETGDLLSMLLSARDAETGEGLSDAEVRDQVMTLFIAGHEPTANALAWTWHLLTMYPHMQRRLHGKLAAVLGGGAPAFHDLAHLPYVRMVIEEAMRLYPPTWLTARSPIEDDEIGGYHIPADSVVLLSPYVMHRHPAFWEDPEAFDPERFTPERVASRPRYAYFPFGGGPRMCMGMHFALMEAQLIVAMVAQIYRLAPVPGHPVEPHPMIALRPRHGVLVTLDPRSA